MLVAEFGYNMVINDFVKVVFRSVRTYEVQTNALGS